MPPAGVVHGQEEVNVPFLWLVGSCFQNENATPRIEIGLSTKENDHRNYRFYVKDNGIGIDQKQLDRIFMPFQRATADPKYEGTGIGLAIVKRVIELHGGRVSVESRKGEGTTFHFTVPKPILS